jgi:hypothetical protein
MLHSGKCKECRHEELKTDTTLREELPEWEYRIREILKGNILSAATKSALIEYVRKFQGNQYKAGLLDGREELESFKANLVKKCEGIIETHSRKAVDSTDKRTLDEGIGFCKCANEVIQLVKE